MNQAHGRELALQRLLGKRFTKIERRPAPGAELSSIPLRILRDAFAHQSEPALRLVVACCLPLPER
jgi:hypothetical protein